METTKAKLINNSSHSATIDNEVAKTLYPTLQGILFDLEDFEENQLNANEQKILLLTRIGDALNKEHKQFYLFTDNEIIQKTTPISKIIKSLLNAAMDNRYQVIIDNMTYFQNLINSNSNSHE